jgi:TrmH family RNA methyltransferase
MKIISSNENKNFKLCIQLAQKKYRDKLGLYLIEGINLLDEALNNNVDIKFIVFNDEMFSTEEISKKTGLHKGTEVFVMPEKLFIKLAQTETSQGVLGVINKNHGKEDEVEKKVMSGYSNVVVLDRLQDPGNIGTIIRTADAAGYKGIIVLKGTADIYAPKVIRAAAGSVFRMPVLFFDSPAQVLECLNKYEKKIVSTCFDTEINYYDIDLKNNIGLIIGNEGNGICRELMEGSDIKIKIPMAGKVESLNAAVAAGIIMFEAIRQ